MMHLTNLYDANDADDNDADLTNLYDDNLTNLGTIL